MATWELGFFAADNWTVRPGLNLNLGLRYDGEPGAANQNLNLASFPETIPFIGNPSKRGSDKDFGPRVARRREHIPRLRGHLRHDGPQSLR